MNEKQVKLHYSVPARGKKSVNACGHTRIRFPLLCRSRGTSLSIPSAWMKQSNFRSEEGLGHTESVCGISSSFRLNPAVACRWILGARDGFTKELVCFPSA